MPGIFPPEELGTNYSFCCDALAPDICTACSLNFIPVSSKMSSKQPCSFIVSEIATPTMHILIFCFHFPHSTYHHLIYVHLNFLKLCLLFTTWKVSSIRASTLPLLFTAASLAPRAVPATWKVLNQYS